MRVRFVRGLGGLAVLWGGAAAAEEGVPRLLLDLSLDTQPVRLVSIDSHSLTYIDSRGLVRTEGLDQYVALLPASDDAPPAPIAGSPASGPTRPPDAILDLADGQRFVGAPTGQRGDEAVMEWKAAGFGDEPIPVPLGLIRRVTLRPGPPTGAAPRMGEAAARDLLVLVNGDTLDGFIESIGDPTRIEHDSSPVDVPLERIAEVRLGGPRRAPSGIMVWLRSGTVASVSSLSTSHTGELTLLLAPLDSSEGSAQSFRAVVPLDQLRGAAFDAGRLTPLAALAPTQQAAAPERVYGDPLRIGPASGAMLGAPDIEFPGPMSVTWALPAGALRLGGRAALPEDCRTWGDCILVMAVRSGPGESKEVLRVHLNGAAPRADFNILLPVDAGRGVMLTATVEAGEYGPIQDRVVLERAVLLTAR